MKYIVDKVRNFFKTIEDKKVFAASVEYLNQPYMRRYEELFVDIHNFDSANSSREEVKEWSDKNREWLCLAGMVGGWTPKKLENGKLVPVDCVRYH